MLRSILLTAAACAVPVTAQTPVPATVEAPAFDPATARAAVTDLANEIEENFVFPDVAKRYAAMLRTKLAAGGYDSFPSRVAFAEAVTADLQAVFPDGHLAMHASTGPRPEPHKAGDTAPPAMVKMPPLMEQAGMIAPGIAYVRFNAFMGTPEVLRDFTAFLDAKAGAKTLIIDARTHRGGGLDEMDVLFPRIFAKPATVMVMDTRASVAKAQGGLPFKSLTIVAAPRELARAEHRVVPLSPASPWTKAKIYLLTSGRTASAAEHLSSVLKSTHRATLVGETTAGAGNYGGGVVLPGGYGAFIPFGHSYFPGEKGWEGTGITPDIAVAPERALYEVLKREGIAPAEAQALSDAHKPSGAMTRRRPLRS